MDIIIFGEITQDSAREAMESLKDAIKRYKTTNTPIRIIISSRGGDSDYAVALHDFLRLHSKEAHIEVIATGVCMSAATVILMGVPLNRRKATEHTVFMLHKPKWNMNGYYSTGEIRAAADEVNITEDVMKDIYEELDLNLEGSTEYQHADLFLSPDEAISIGLISEVVE